MPLWTNIVHHHFRDPVAAVILLDLWESVHRDPRDKRAHAECAICLGTVPLEKISVLSCGHTFCIQHGRGLLKGRRTCPFCRQNIESLVERLYISIPGTSEDVDSSQDNAIARQAEFIKNRIATMDESTKFKSIKQIESEVHKVTDSMEQSSAADTILVALDDFKHRVLPQLQPNHNEMAQLKSDLAAEKKRAAKIERDHERTLAKLTAQREQVSELTREAKSQRIQLMKLDDVSRQLELTTAELNSQRSRLAKLMQEEGARERVTEELRKKVRLRDETINKQALDLTKYKGWLDQRKDTAKKNEAEIKALRLENVKLKEAQTRSVVGETSKALSVLDFQDDGNVSVAEDWDTDTEEPRRGNHYVSLSSSPTSNYLPLKRRRIDSTRQTLHSSAKSLQPDLDLGDTGMPPPGFGSKSIPRSAFTRTKELKKPQLNSFLQGGSRTSAFPITTNNKGKASGVVQIGPRHTVRIRGT